MSLITSCDEIQFRILKLLQDGEFATGWTRLPHCHIEIITIIICRLIEPQISRFSMTTHFSNWHRRVNYRHNASEKINTIKLKN